jgi:hypothetical protein
MRVSSWLGGMSFTVAKVRSSEAVFTMVVSMTSCQQHLRISAVAEGEEAHKGGERGSSMQVSAREALPLLAPA